MRVNVTNVRRFSRPVGRGRRTVSNCANGGATTTMTSGKKCSEQMFKQYNWHDFYRDAEEAIPGDMPKPRGNPMSTHCFVDASHGRERSYNETIANWRPNLLQQQGSDHLV